MKSIVPDYCQTKLPAAVMTSGWLDVYQLAEMYGLADHALFQAVKKILCAGRRRAKDREQDVGEALFALIRWHELNSGSRLAEIFLRVTDPGADAVQHGAQVEIDRLRQKLQELGDKYRELQRTRDATEEIEVECNALRRAIQEAEAKSGVWQREVKVATDAYQEAQDRACKTAEKLFAAEKRIAYLTDELSRSTSDESVMKLVARCKALEQCAAAGGHEANGGSNCVRCGVPLGGEPV